MKIKAYVGYNERRNERLYRVFDVVKNLPTVGDDYIGATKVVNVYESPLDCKNDDNVYGYEFYVVVLKNDDGEEFNEYVCVEKEEESRMIEVNNNVLHFFDINNDDVNFMLNIENKTVKEILEEVRIYLDENCFDALNQTELNKLKQIK